MSDSRSVAVLGLGAMGHAFAANLLKADFDVTVWNRSADKAEDLVEVGARLADSPADAVARAQAVILMLPDLAVTRDVLLGGGALAAMPASATLIQMGTLGVAETDRLIAETGDARDDVVFIDAPVSGTKAPAEQGKIAILASGDRERAAAVVEPIFDVLGKQTHWLGQAGQGARMKIVVNAWLVSMMQGIAETAHLADTLGFTTDDLWQVLDGGPLATPYMKLKLDMIASGDFDPQMAMQWGLKDAGLALEAGDGKALPSLTQIRNLWSDAVSAGYGEEDIASIHAYLEKYRHR
ncbi:NAD(P)-dependent oxidoreductase [Salinicola sp. LHM]|jgi:3-hydroxyisobutyrate dehydrogenase|uniref:NAD(P)-dependent oxidoreductase n=1 Tax=Salinicola sp. LHM TaxID=3065298 RepID=UPI002ACDD234|nr:NAD(P)-dependent oxidoreductase [Salinicola sp. LHM]WQH32380.1 NAD(P)-dependent oxidoreductase [Salinicola sp. LHM]